jgi:hypothetical protein
VPSPNPAWAEVRARVVDESHLVPGEQLSAVVNDAVRPLGLTAEVLLADRAQRVLSPVHPKPAAGLNAVGTLAGHAYQVGEIVLRLSS